MIDTPDPCLQPIAPVHKHQGFEEKTFLERLSILRPRFRIGTVCILRFVRRLSCSLSHGAGFMLSDLVANQVSGTHDKGSISLVGNKTVPLSVGRRVISVTP